MSAASDVLSSNKSSQSLGDSVIRGVILPLDPNVIEREIEKRRRRALSLGVDILVTRIYFEHGFRNYSLFHSSSM